MFRIIFLTGLSVFASNASAEDALWQRLKGEPRMVVLVPHSDASGGEPLTWDATGGCQGESRLTDSGKALAKRIGDTFASHGIEATVVSSPQCRATETARIAFGEPVVTVPALREISGSGSGHTEEFEAEAMTNIRQRLGSKPVVMVSHRPNINHLTHELVKSDELIIAKANPAGELEVEGKIRIRR